MIMCAKCDNETRAAELVTAQGPVMLSGPQGSAPQPILAQACTACGYIELYGPQPIVDLAERREAALEPTPVPAPAAVA
jgi:predicted nucleic-acid-binding Zn-ribbon protein